LNIIAFDIGGTRFRAGLFNAAGEKLAALEGETLRSGGREWMLRELEARTQTLRRTANEPVTACGVSFGGPVDFARQSVTSVHTPGWENFALSEWVKQTLGFCCLVDNDANAGALGEYRFGAGRGAQSMIYLTLSTGIGGGVICHGQLHRGRDGTAGEIGHFPLSDSESLCTCGLYSGCTEALASGRSLDRQAREFAASHPKEAARMIELAGGKAVNVTARELVRAAREGDPAATDLFNTATGWLARALLIAIRLLDPDKIVLGGGVAQAGDFLLSSLDRHLKRWWSPQFPYSTQFVLAELGSYSPLYGAAALALDLVRDSFDP
jgi:glucokinase